MRHSTQSYVPRRAIVEVEAGRQRETEDADPDPLGSTCPPISRRVAPLQAVRSGGRAPVPERSRGDTGVGHEGREPVVRRAGRVDARNRRARCLSPAPPDRRGRDGATCSSRRRARSGRRVAVKRMRAGRSSTTTISERSFADEADARPRSCATPTSSSTREARRGERPRVGVEPASCSSEPARPHAHGGAARRGLAMRTEGAARRRDPRDRRRRRARALHRAPRAHRQRRACRSASCIATSSPHNVFVCTDGVAKVLDLGIAKARSQAARARAPVTSRASSRTSRRSRSAGETRRRARRRVRARHRALRAARRPPAVPRRQRRQVFASRAHARHPAAGRPCARTCRPGLGAVALRVPRSAIAIGDSPAPVRSPVRDRSRRDQSPACAALASTRAPPRAFVTTLFPRDAVEQARQDTALARRSSEYLSSTSLLAIGPPTRELTPPAGPSRRRGACACCATARCSAALLVTCFAAFLTTLRRRIAAPSRWSRTPIPAATDGRPRFERVELTRARAGRRALAASVPQAPRSGQPEALACERHARSRRRCPVTVGAQRSPGGYASPLHP